MRIDPVTFQVESDGGIVEPLYVWETPVRFWHWAMAIAMVILIATGLLIGLPLHSNFEDTWETYQFGYIRAVHFIAGFIYIALFAYRVIWMIFGNRYSRMIFFPPLWSFKWWMGIINQGLYYVFLKKSAPEYAGHNPLAQVAMWFFFVLGSLVVMFTGLALYAQAYGDGTPWMVCFGWVGYAFGDWQTVRSVHHWTMYVIGLFMWAHLYMSFREDVMGGATTVSSMISGLRMFKEHHGILEQAKGL